MFGRLMLAVRRMKWVRQYIRPLYYRLNPRKSLMRADSYARDALVELVGSLPSNRQMVMVEVGSFRGESAEIFLNTNRFSRIYCIDPWKNFYDKNDWASFSNMAKVERDFDRRVGGDERVVKVKGTIDTFFERYPNIALDFAYIDGCHTYDAVKHDLTKIMTTSRPRVAVAGHDFLEKEWEGVTRAVKECIGSPDAVFPDTSWVKYLG